MVKCNNRPSPKIKCIFLKWYQSAHLIYDPIYLISPFKIYQIPTIILSTGVNQLHRCPHFLACFKDIYMVALLTHLFDVRSRVGRLGGSECWSWVDFGGLESTSETGFNRNTPPRFAPAGYTLSPPGDKVHLDGLSINTPTYVLVLGHCRKGCF